MDFALVFLGGGAGAVARYAVSLAGKSTGLGVGASTLAINLSGSFLIGLVFSLFGRNLISPSVRLLIMTGFLGGFTTFSTYSLDIVSSLRAGRIGPALLVAIVANLGGFFCAALGILVGGKFDSGFL